MENNTEKVFGTYTGCLTAEGIGLITSGTELQLYLTIFSLGGYIWRTNHDAYHGWIELTKEDYTSLIECQYAIEFAVLQTRRFGVEIPEPKNNEHVKRTDSYNKWFRWWDDYIQQGLTDEEHKVLDSLINNNKDYSEFRPKGDWKDNNG